MKNVVRWAVPGLIAMLASGCAIVGGSPPERDWGNTSLSEAAKEASKDSTEKRKRLDVGDKAPTWPSESGIEVETRLSDPDEEGLPSPHGSHSGTGSGFIHPNLGVVIGGGSLGGQEFSGFGLGGLDLGFSVPPRWQFDVQGLVLTPNLTSYSLAGQGFKDEVELALDLSARFYLTPPHTFTGIYPIAGLRFGSLFWNFRRPVNVYADGRNKTLEDDYINYYAIYGGLGVSLIQARHFRANVNLIGGGRDYDKTTFEGFPNDLFPATGFTQVAVELNYRF
jgi:hypothetical protein